MKDAPKSGIEGLTIDELLRPGILEKMADMAAAGADSSINPKARCTAASPSWRKKKIQVCLVNGEHAFTAHLPMFWLSDKANALLHAYRQRQPATPHRTPAPRRGARRANA